MDNLTYRIERLEGRIDFLEMVIAVQLTDTLKQRKLMTVTTIEGTMRKALESTNYAKHRQESFTSAKEQFLQIIRVLIEARILLTQAKSDE